MSAPRSATSGTPDIKGSSSTTPTLVGARVDRLRIAYAAPVDVARILASGGVDVGSERYRVDARKRRGRALGLAGQGVEVAVSERIADVDLRAPYLVAHTPAEAVAMAERVARALRSHRGPIGRGVVWGLDLCADIAGATFRADDLRAFVTRLRGADTWHERARRTARDPVVTGLSVGSEKAILVTVYNKSAQLRGRSAESAAMERAGWAAHGWGSGDVWRVECRLRGRALTEYGLRDPADLAAQIDAVWRALVTDVVRLVALDTATRRERCGLDPRWKAVQGATFVHAASEPATRERAPIGGPSTAALVGSAASWLARRAVPHAQAVELIRAIIAAGGSPAEVAALRGRVDRAWEQARPQRAPRVGPGPRKARIAGARKREASGGGGA